MTLEELQQTEWYKSLSRSAKQFLKEYPLKEIYVYPEDYIFNIATYKDDMVLIKIEERKENKIELAIEKQIEESITILEYQQKTRVAKVKTTSDTKYGSLWI